MFIYLSKITNFNIGDMLKTELGEILIFIKLYLSYF